MGAAVSIHDIDTAHRVKPINASNRPKPIFCKFIRRLTREEVVSKRTEISQVAPQDVGLPGTSSLTNAMVVDHSFSTFYNKLNRIVNKHAPLKTISKRKAKQLNKPWITKGLRIS